MQTPRPGPSSSTPRAWKKSKHTQAARTKRSVHTGD